MLNKYLTSKRVQGILLVALAFVLKYFEVDVEGLYGQLTDDMATAGVLWNMVGQLFARGPLTPTGLRLSR